MITRQKRNHLYPEPKTTEELADMLMANGIKAVAYHAGMDSKMRAEQAGPVPE